jgi:hypothetical protein
VSVLRVWLRAAALAAALLPLPAAATDPLQMPAAIVFPQAVDLDNVRGAILTALARRRWIAEADIEGGFVAVLQVRDHLLRIRIEYESRQVRYVYVNSRNLDYEIDDDGVPQIHYKVNRWLSALDLEMKRQLQLVMFDRDRVQVRPPREPPPAAAPQAAPPPPAAVPGALRAGGTAVLVQAQALRSRPMADASAVATLAPGSYVQLVSVMRNLSGTWWYVNAGQQPGWLLEASLRPPP